MYNIFKLNNGLRVVIEDIEYVNSVSVGLWVENGSRNENYINNGISHFIEHMMFKGTYKRTSKEIAEAIENVGGQMNAFTGKEATCFHTKTLYNHLELSLDVLSDMILNSKLDNEEIEKEKGVVIEEINMCEDSPEDVLSDLHSRAIWGDDPISYPVLGTIDNVNSFTREMIKSYMANYYVPENSVLSICGKINISEAKKIIEEYFGGWSSEKSLITNYSSPSILRNNFVREKKIEQIHLSLGLKGLEIGSKDLYPMFLANNAFGGGVSSCLFQKIREELGLCYTVYSFNSTFNNTGALTIYTGVSPKYVYLAVEAILEELKKFSYGGAEDIKLDIAKEQLKGTYILGSESVSSRMFSNGKSVLILNKVKTPEDIINEIDAIKKEDIEAVINKTFKEGIYNSAFVGDGIDINKINELI